MTTKIHIQATHQQVEQFNQRCELSEMLFAKTLAERIQGMSAADAEPFILDWFKSVRTMAVANHITSGIKAGIAEPTQN